jgi:hypothetical protein
MPLRCSHTPASPTKTLLALVAAAIVRSHDPTWLARPIADLARESGVRPERVSRLKRKLFDRFQSLVEKASRRGRPRRRRPLSPPPVDPAREVLLEVAADLVRSRGVKRREIQDHLVAARDRLCSEHGLTHRDFCRSLGLSERTVRSWAERGPAAPRPPDPAPAPPSPPASRNVGRFDLETTLPGLQAMADTSDFKLFDVPLKIVAVQDPGRRRQRLWEAFELEDHEDHQVVVDVVAKALEDRPGTQILTDQGTPYLAEAARDAYEDLELEHAPQKEGTPTDKATLERSFLTVKSALAPMIALSAHLSRAVPALRSPALAKALGRILLATFLRVYTAAREAPEGHRPADPIVLEALAETQREKARAENRSVKLALESHFERYQFEGSRTRFVRAHRHHRVEDVIAAEREMGRYACRCRAKHCDRYFAAILNKVAQAGRTRRRRERRERLRRHRVRKAEARARAQSEQNRRHPEEAVARALHLLALQYRPEKDRLLFHGATIGRGRLLRAVLHTIEESPLVWRDRAEVGWKMWIETSPDSAPRPHVRSVFDDVLATVAPGPNPRPRPTAEDILNPGPRQPAQPRPSSGKGLRIWPAGSGST